MDFYAATANCTSSRHSILRLWHGPSPRAYSMGIISHMGFHTACRIVSCSVVMLTRSRRYATIIRRVRPWRRARPKAGIDESISFRISAWPEKGIVRNRYSANVGDVRCRLSHMSFHAATANCASLRHSILRLWRGPSPRAYSREIIAYRLSCRL